MDIAGNSQTSPPYENNNLLPAERHLRIRELLRERVTIRVTELSEKLGVSEMTIRRDLEALERQGALERTHGGAVYRHERVSYENGYESRLKEFVDLLDLVGRKAASLIAPNDSILLHCGTTALHLLRYLDPEMPVRIYTNNIGAIDEVRGKKAELVLLGGELRRDSNSLEGPLTMQMIRQIHPTRAFLAADGISMAEGITSSCFAEADFQRAMIEQTRGQVVVMAGNGAFGRVAEVQVAPLERADILILDRTLPREPLRDLELLGVQVLVA
ncbi:DeoR/GlpR family DNA-binding transcription regulator [Pelobacter propionicus]|uniref:Transcriptional regulator, DeoR family n=1 Tax=Pelobacter propionicus (strain DSM 2379 / NBRC 103807 / OttBd1) TaxID=338966 RepID=A1ANZ5_PELPD|nr:DeoR/GlpR family DNA-binding transcription regulator [Pelobacter propionicus]ABK99065.1 transcriptional regulator, DeoR family [Pelobacter propionicus DSM 2379]